MSGSKAPEKKKEASKALTERFIKGLKEYDLTFEEITSGKWSYCGGDTGCHYKYWKLCCPNQETPEKTKWCVCGHPIVENCYITDGPTILILGNCCIKKFIPKSSRTCEICKEPHKNRKDNLCNKCREIRRCLDCKTVIQKPYARCYNCYVKYRFG